MRKEFLISLLLFFAVVIFYIISNLFQTEGYYCYLLDDTFIHLAVAKNFAIHGVWGMTPHTISSSSSSPLFTIILAALIQIFGDSHLIPLIINLILAVGVIFILYRHYSDSIHNRNFIIIAILITMFSAVMHLQVVVGMEHVLQVLAFAFCIYHVQQWIISDFKNNNSEYWFYFSLPFLGLIRFESMFFLVSLSFGFLLLQKFAKSITILLLGFIPIIIFCYFNYKTTGYLFPFSVVVKGTAINLQENLLDQLYVHVFKKFLFNISVYKIALFPIIITIIFWIKDFRKIGFRASVLQNFISIVAVLTMIMHAMFADLKGFFRYEAYILVVFLMALIPKLIPVFQNFFVSIKKLNPIAWSVLFYLIIIVYKFGYAHLMIWYGGKNIYEQQVQSARFLQQYYPKSKILANDIGAICYYTEIHLFDIVGLGSKVTVPYNKNGKKRDEVYGRFIKNYTEKEQYEVAIIYDEWLEPFIPNTWTKIATLKINDNMTCAEDHISIYSMQKSKDHILRKRVGEFNWNSNVQLNTIIQD